MSCLSVGYIENLYIFAIPIYTVSVLYHSKKKNSHPWHQWTLCCCRLF